MSWVKTSQQQSKLSNFTNPTMMNDPYQKFLQKQTFSKNLIAYDGSSKFSKKLAKFTAKLHQAKYNALNGAMMGFMVGGLFGFVIGVYSAIQSRRFIVIPISVLVSGGSFGFILGCGSMIRSDTINNNIKDQIDFEIIQKWNKNDEL